MMAFASEIQEKDLVNLSISSDNTLDIFDGNIEFNGAVCFFFSMKVLNQLKLELSSCSSKIPSWLMTKLSETFVFSP